MRAEVIDGVRVFHVPFSQDERGSSLQLICGGAYRALTAHNPQRATLRGLHSQHPGQRKIVTCTAGAIYDVLVDLRVDSPTRMQWKAFHLTPGDALSVPPGCAHGYLTLEPHTSLLYLLGGTKNDDLGTRWDDPALGIEWPFAPEIISERDRSWRLI